MSWIDQMRRAEARLTPRRLNGMFYYDAERGWLIWRAGRHRGQVAGYAHPNGYIMVKINRRFYRAHRIIWAMVTGQWPQEFIDHKNGIGVDNWWSNLRSATKGQNNTNKKIKLGASGLRRVVWNKDNGNWMARLKSGGKLRHLGCFPTKEEAYAAACRAAEEAHGEFARFD